MWVKASPSVASAPLYLVTNAKANMQAIVNSAQRTRTSVPANSSKKTAQGTRSQSADRTAARKMAEPVAESQFNS